MFGVLPVNKPPGMTSRDVCNRIERIVRPDKVGHTGTLDPLATGVLLLAVGSASRLVEFSLGHDKEYVATFQIGVCSETLDVDAEIFPLESPAIPRRAAWETEARRWIGRVQQVPPKFSAINVGGRRAYDLARKGCDFELAAREIEVQAIDVMQYDYPLLTLRITCGSGTYVRSLGNDMAQALGTAAVMSSLVRTRIGPFELTDCVALDELRSADAIADCLRAPQLLIAKLPSVVLDTEQCSRIRHGIPLQLPQASAEKLVALDSTEQLVAVLTRTTAAANYRSVRVFHETSATSHPNTISSPHNPES